MIVGVISVGRVISKTLLRITGRMIGGHIHPSPVFSFFKLQGMPRRVSVTPPVFSEIVRQVPVGLLGTMYLGRDVHAFAPGLPVISRGFVPGFTQTVAFT